MKWFSDPHANLAWAMLIAFLVSITVTPEATLRRQWDALTRGEK